MKSFRKIFAAVIVFVIVVFIVANIFLMSLKAYSGSPYRVEIERLAYAIRTEGFGTVDLSDCLYVTDVIRYEGKSQDTGFFEETNEDYLIRVIDGTMYRFDYVFHSRQEHRIMVITVNLILGVMSFALLVVMLFIRNKILKPFAALCEVPYELSKGNLTVPVKEDRYHFFGRFVWGTNVLRENLEQQRKRELDLQREKKVLVLSLSHDIKTPLSAIKLYTKALSKGLYKEKEKQLEIAGNINAKADEIEKFLAQIIEASSEDFLELQVQQGEFYLSELVDKISAYYQEKLEIMKIRFSVGEYSNCILKGDLDRSVEVLQNIIENAVKYGDGDMIMLEFSEEEDCRLVTVENTGCTLPESELPHIFESFIRGTNAENISGSGLGLYICRQLLHQMGGEIFAQIKDTKMYVTAIFVMI